MPVKVRYENNVLKPLEKLDLIDGEEVEIEIMNQMQIDKRPTKTISACAPSIQACPALRAP